MEEGADGVTPVSPLIALDLPLRVLLPQRRCEVGVFLWSTSRRFKWRGGFESEKNQCFCLRIKIQCDI